MGKGVETNVGVSHVRCRIFARAPLTRVAFLTCIRHESFRCLIVSVCYGYLKDPLYLAELRGK